MRVQKRNGTVVPFDPAKVEGAILKAFNAAQPGNIPALDDLVAQVETQLTTDGDEIVGVEAVQDVVEKVLMANGYLNVAKAYILYRQKRTEARAERLTPDPEAVASYVHVAKYAAHIRKGKRRETYLETVERSERMHLSRFADARRLGAISDPEFDGGSTRVRVSVGDSREPIEFCIDGDARGDLVDRVAAGYVLRAVDLVTAAFRPVKAKRVLPSMRSMQFGGQAVECNNVRMYNCAFTLINRKRAFGEILYVLLAGVGAGFSVQFQHVDQLPAVKPVDRTRTTHHTVADSIEGWAEAVNELMRGFYETGAHVEFNYSRIRARGEPISSGGLAPGHIPLKESLEAVRAILEGAAYRKLRPIECHDVICHLAMAVLSGGIRRSSLISLFSIDDSEMLYSKADGNFVAAGMKDDAGQLLTPKNVQRQMANNSAAALRGTTTREQFRRVVSVSRQWGDPGVYWTWDLDFGCNPCGEIGLYPVLIRDWPAARDDTLDFKPYVPRDTVLEDIGRTPQKYIRILKDEAVASLVDGAVKVRLGLEKFKPSEAHTDGEAAEEYGSATGWQFCNLCEVNVAACPDRAAFLEASAAAATIGTLQAAYASFPYLGPVTERIVRREALLGVGLTGVMDRPEVGLDPQTLRLGAARCVATNREVARFIGINPAARVTTVKPSGTASLELGCVGSGIHPHHARRYFRRVTANPMEPQALHFRKVNPHMVEVKPDGDLSLVFPVQPPDGAVTLEDVRASEFMENVFNVYAHWVLPGTVDGLHVGQRVEPGQGDDGPGWTPKLTHNVSATVVVRDDEWPAVIEKAWENRGRIAAMSFFSDANDHAFPFAPRMAVSTPADEARWNEIIAGYRPVDWSKLGEEEDTVNRTAEPACAGGACEV